MAKRLLFKQKFDKDALKFSSAHLTIFPDGTKESLHGHTYRVRLTVWLKSPRFPQMIDFATFKELLKPLCDAWDERVLLARNNPHVTVKEAEETLHYTACGKNYSFPRDEVALLDVDNITSENLAALIASSLEDALCAQGLWRTKSNAAAENLQGFEIEVEETPGQSASIEVWGGEDVSSK